MKRPFFSLCIPVYNSGAICAKAIESALQQDFKDYEIVIVDDCSNDNSWEVLKGFADMHEKIKLFKNEMNLGMTANWDRCLALAQGKYIGFVHHDDAISKDFLKDAFDIFNSYSSVGIVAFLNQNNGSRPLMGLIDSKKYFQYTFSIINIPPPSETLFKKEINMHYDEAMIYCPEVDIYLKLAKLGYDAFHSDKRNVTRNPSGWTGSVTSRRQYSFDRFQDYLYILKKWKNDDWLTKKDILSLFQRTTEDVLKRYIRGSVLGISESKQLFNEYKAYLADNHGFDLELGDKYWIFAKITPKVILKGITSFGFKILSKVKKN